jgi:uncharacterized protein (TIGR02118 family)
MIKLVYVVRRRPELGVEEFRKYWLEQHGPLVRSVAKALRATRYVQSHTLDVPFNAIAQQTRGSQGPYDGITEVWWDRAEDLAAALASPEGQEANRRLTEDEGRFVDLARSSLFFTEEYPIF